MWKSEREWRALVDECNRWATLRNDQSGESLAFNTMEFHYEEFDFDDEEGHCIELKKKKDIIVLRRCPIIGPVQSIERLFHMARDRSANRFDGNKNFVKIHNQADAECCLTKGYRPKED